MRAFQFFRRSQRQLIQRHNAEPAQAKATTASKKSTVSYSDILNLPSAGMVDLQDADGKLTWLMDYDALP